MKFSVHLVEEGLENKNPAFLVELDEFQEGFLDSYKADLTDATSEYREEHLVIKPVLNADTPLDLAGALEEFHIYSDGSKELAALLEATPVLTEEESEQ